VNVLREAYAAQTDAQLRERLSEELATVYLALWGELRRPLCALIGRRWARSAQFRQLIAEHSGSFAATVEALALNVFGDLLPYLAGLELDPVKNGVSYLLTIASRQLSAQDQLLMREQHEPLEGGVEGEEHHSQEPADEQQAELFEQMAEHIDQQECVRLVLHFWHETLNHEDWQLVRERLLHSPPLPFATIAQMMGPGFTSAALRQRLRRICQRTRDFLRDNGWEEVL
jgi:hypothetical protein